MGKNSGSSLFLMELIMAILIFSLASTVCIQLFVKSHLLSRKSLDLNQSVLWTQNLAECFLSANGDLTQLGALFPQSSTGDDSVCLYFNQSWQEIPAEQKAEAVYQVMLCLQPSDTDTQLAQVQILSIAFHNAASSRQPEDGDVIYELSLSKYIGEEAGL